MVEGKVPKRRALSGEWAQALLPVSHLKHKQSFLRTCLRELSQKKATKGCQCIHIYIIPNIFLNVIYMSEPLKASYSINCTPGGKLCRPRSVWEQHKGVLCAKKGIGLDGKAPKKDHLAA